ncbi:MAG: hypothetical protein ACK5MK_05015 [Dysgonomonas sp.]
MNIREFYELIDTQNAPDISLLPKLKFLVNKYSYFQAGIFTYLKCLYTNNDEAFIPELNRLSVSVLDRKALFYYILSDEYSRFYQKRGRRELSKDRTTILMDAFFESLGDDNESAQKEIENAINNTTLATLDYFSYLDSANELSDKSSVEESLDGESLAVSDEDQEQAVLSEDVEKEQEQPPITDHPESEIEEKSQLLKHHDIIDSFINMAEEETSMKIVFDMDQDYGANEDYDDPETDEEMSGDDIFFTETLANIYIKQKKYERAYEIIQRLSLNYPKKNIYFADQLAFLEKLIINTKNKK